MGKTGVGLLMMVVLALSMIPLQVWHKALGCHEEMTINTVDKHPGGEQLQQQKFNCTCAVQQFVSPVFETASRPIIQFFKQHTKNFDAEPIAIILSPWPQSHNLRGPPVL